PRRLGALRQGREAGAGERRAGRGLRRLGAGRGRLMRTAAIMQPTYLPYLGYFHLIAASDVFVFLDDVQFARRSWQQRNRIWGAAGEVMLSVPVQKTDRDAPICEIEISEAEPWREKHLASVRHAYAKRPFFA